MQKYANVPMSLAEACLVRMTETHADSVILTTDSHILTGRLLLPVWWQPLDAGSLIRLFPQKSTKPFLFEMVIRGESSLDLSVPHEDETHGITQRITLVRATPEKFHSLSVEALVYPYCFHKWIVQERAQEVESRLSRKFASLRQGHEFHQHVIVYDFSARLFKEVLCLGMLRLVPVVVAEQS